MNKIGLYIPDLSNGGAERVVSRLSNILSERYEVMIILNENVMKYEVDCSVINLDIPPTNNIFKKAILPILRAHKLKKFITENQIDCVISFLTSANIVNALAKTKQASTILSVRNFTEIERENSIFINKIKDKIMKVLYKRSDYVVSVSLDLKNSLVRNYGIPYSKVKAIYNPYDVSEISLLSEEVICDKEIKSFLNSGKIFVTMGRFSHQKGYWHLIKAFSLISSCTDDAKLLIIGDGSDRKKIEKLIEELNLEDKILLAGYQKNPFKYISKCYAYVLSSLFEGFPNAMVEAITCKCPVIAVDCKSGPREILFNNVDLNRKIDCVERADYGIIVPSLLENESWSPKYIDESQKKLADAMMMLIADVDIRNNYVNKSIKCVERFNYSMCLEQFSEVLENAISKTN